MLDDRWFMQQALLLAQRAFDEDEVPIGAVVVHNGKIVGKGWNQTERLQDPTAHAEMLAITAATQSLGSKYLIGCTLYVTVEPCVMCGGASRWAQVERVVYGASEHKVGYNTVGAGVLHPKTAVVSGVLADECRGLMQTFFEAKRKK